MDQNSGRNVIWEVYCQCIRSTLPARNRQKANWPLIGEPEIDLLIYLALIVEISIPAERQASALHPLGSLLRKRQYNGGYAMTWCSRIMDALCVR